MDTEVPVSANFWECIPVFSAFYSYVHFWECIVVFQHVIHMHICTTNHYLKNSK